MGQFTSKKKTSIVKFQTKASKRLPTVKDALDYITDSSKTNPDLTCTRFLSDTYPLESWFTFNKDTEPRKNAREYIHGIVSPIPSDEVSEATYMLLAKELMLLIHDYPMIVTIHRDKPKHIHLHFLIHPFNVDTEKRWQQSKKDLREFKIQLNKILAKHGFHPINGYGLNQEDDNSPTYETSIAIQKPSSVSSADSIENMPNQVQTNWNESYDWSHWPTWDIPSARADPAPTPVPDLTSNTVSSKLSQQNTATKKDSFIGNESFHRLYRPIWTIGKMQSASQAISSRKSNRTTNKALENIRPIWPDPHYRAKITIVNDDSDNLFTINATNKKGE